MSDPRPDLLAALPGLIAARIHILLPGLRQCEGMAGRFDLDELKTVQARAPAVLVSRLGSTMPRPLAGPHYIYALRMAAFVVTRDALDLQRDLAAASICQALLQRIPDAAWGLGGVGPATDVADQSLSGAALKAKGISLWAVSWTQPVTLSPLPAQSVIPVALYVGQAPWIGAAHEDDYDLVGGEP